MKSISRRYIILAAILVLQACSHTEAPGNGDKCPPMNNGHLVYVEINQGNDRVDCTDGKCDDYLVGGVYCPEGDKCGRNGEGYFCYYGPDSMIVCNDKKLTTKKGTNCTESCVVDDEIYCGARGYCDEADPSSKNYRGMVCGSNAKCDQGKCVCKYKDSDPAHCGAKGACFDDDDDPASPNYRGMRCPNGSRCISGECVCDDSDNYELCKNNANQLECVKKEDFKVSREHCGGCGKVCEGRCIDGECWLDSCGEHTCGRVECGNRNNRCGKECVDCTATDDGRNICDDMGECRACEEGNVYDTELGKCLSPNARDCNGVDCATTVSNWESDGLSCVDGVCVVTKCATGFHVSKVMTGTPKEPVEIGTGCEKDSTTQCGEPPKNCLDSSVYHDEHATAVGCFEGHCVSLACGISDEVEQNSTGNYFGKYYYHEQYMPTYLKKGYEYNHGKCAEISAQFCGTDPENMLNCVGLELGGCTGSIPDYCKEGCNSEELASADDSCILKDYHCQCSVGTHYSANQCKPDSEKECGDQHENCQELCDQIDNCISAGCEFGKCVVKSCSNGLLPCTTNNKCVTKMLTECLPKDVNKACSLSTLPGEIDIVRPLCDPGYHVYNGDCEKDDFKHCGSHGNTCITKDVNATAVCRNGSCDIDCAHGYHKYELSCEQDTIKNCGEHGVECSKDIKETHAFPVCVEKDGGDSRSAFGCDFECERCYNKIGGTCVRDFGCI